MPFCTNCGHENPEGSNFCGQCGSALVPGAARAATPEKVPTG
ncbi:MAG TPA: zinc-ribbon domain-containing protein, partial [Propionibacteriaceae bacterium]|nr:zinc-ribbon domain-containing protein [Propionibacteriaceae bacterium]